MTTDEFIEICKLSHNTKYDYSKTEYEGKTKKVCIICPEHGEFWQIASRHQEGRNCPKCRGKNISKGKTKTKEQFISDAIKIHGDKYDYSKVKYIDWRTPICIICPNHGEVWQIPNDHLNKKRVGCPKCGTEGTRLSQEEFINRSINVHGDKYDYSKVEYINMRTKVCIICPEHGEFWQFPKGHFSRKHGCPICRSSKGETKIRELLNKRHIEFIEQHTFPDCKYKQVLYFDFYLPEHNTCIEYDGIQHFEPCHYYGGNKIFNKTKKRDQIKTNYCKYNNIRLIRIRYDESIEGILNEYI